METDRAEVGAMGISTDGSLVPDDTAPTTFSGVRRSVPEVPDLFVDIPITKGAEIETARHNIDNINFIMGLTYL